MKPAQIKQWEELRNRADSTAIYNSESSNSLQSKNESESNGDTDTSGFRLVSRVEHEGNLLICKVERVIKNFVLNSCSIAYKTVHCRFNARKKVIIPGNWY